jgi:hypothetical protein
MKNGGSDDALVKSTTVEMYVVLKHNYVFLQKLFQVEIALHLCNALN